MNEDTADIVSKALRRAWQLGQTYWQQADSESYSANKRADATAVMFAELVNNTLASLAQPVASGEPVAHVGDSQFEVWHSTYNPAGKGDKQRARDAYAAGMSDPGAAPQPAPVAPQEPAAGWQLVPVEPTQEMCAAAVVFANGNAVYKNVAAEALKIEEAIYGEAYAAMLAAAPEPPHMSMTRDEAQTFQSWAGMDGACAFHLIERHANGWGDVGRMMDAWRQANLKPLNVPHNRLGSA